MIDESTASSAAMEARKTRAAAWFRQLRDEIVADLEALEDEVRGPQAEMPPGRFSIEPWSRPEGGGGEMGMLHGRVFEKFGVHISVVHGRFSEDFARQMPHTEAGAEFWSAGVSVIIHPWSPNVPAAHMNTRMIVTGKWWFGGGGDLTPVLDRRRTQADPDSIDFHAAYRRACEAHPGATYDRYKGWCDEYFFLKHRNETRGVGGLFYDDLDEGGFERCFALTQAVGNGFLDAYLPIVERRKATPYGEREREFQLYRRGRYVEFNLVWDRGTLFGLQSGGRTESILMSLPPRVRFEYGYAPAPGSAEARLAAYLVPRDWLGDAT